MAMLNEAPSERVVENLLISPSAELSSPRSQIENQKCADPLPSNRASIKKDSNVQESVHAKPMFGFG